MAEKSHTFSYDVFVSFKGEDFTEPSSFIGYLLEELKKKEINTFIHDDNEDQMMMLQQDIPLSPALSKAIEDSKILIVVFSENYAFSTRCLDELVKINSRRGGDQHVFSIFYLIEPTKVRYQKEHTKYHEAMAAHKVKFGENSDIIKRWRSALKDICDLSGHHVKDRSEEDSVHEKVVAEIYDKVTSKRLPVKDTTIGLEQRLEEVKSLLDMKDDTVCMLGIYGLGGIGKTELAKALYNKMVHQFQAACFIANVRENSNKINGLECLQKTLLSEMSEVLENGFDSKQAGTYDIKRRLGKKKILLVLDDVDDKEQLDHLAGGCEWFGPGSRVIITTRDENLLRRRHQVKKTYKMVELNDQQSLELFCQNAFKKSIPEEGYEDLSWRAVSYAKGLPLALKVIGSDLATERSSKQGWERVLEEYRMNSKDGIQNILKISYERLQPNAKQVFLDIACFFKGEKKKYLEKILEELYALRNIQLLVRKSLLTIEDDCLNMHDLIQDMGRDIVRKEAPPDSLGKRSRLWSHEDVIQVLKEDLGSDQIEGVMLDPPQQEEVEWSGAAFEKMKCLRILIVRNASFSSEPKDLPNHLRVLDWEEYPSKSFPPRFNPKKIIVFNLRRSNLTLEEPFQKFPSLSFMNFSDNQSITTMPSVSQVPNLTEIRLDDCKNLTKVDESVGSLQKLTHFSASGCAKLRDFPRSMHLPSLEVLDLNLCRRLQYFPEILNNMSKPMKIHMINTAIEKLPDSIGYLTGLTCIEMTGCWKLRYLPGSLLALPNVDTFKIGGCSSNLGESFRMFAHSLGQSTFKMLNLGHSGLSDEDLHGILNCFPKLQELIASENNFVSLPECIKESVQLTSLDVSGCRELRKLPECTSLRILIVHGCEKLEEISELPSTIQKVDARFCCSLTRETLDMLWSQVKKEIRGLQLVMHSSDSTTIPKWFDLKANGQNPHFWARRKFPILALAMFFSKEEGETRHSRRQLVELELVINGKSVIRKGRHIFRMEAEHVLVCDLRVLFSEKEWQGLDEFLVHDWNQVQVSYEASSTMTLSSWGIYVYKKETKMEDLQFMCPSTKSSDIPIIPPTIVPNGDPMQEIRKKVEEMGLDEIFDKVLLQMEDFQNHNNLADDDSAMEHTYELLENLRQLSRECKDVLNGKALDGKSLLEELLKVLEGKYEPGEIVIFRGLALVPVGSEFVPPMDVEKALSSDYGHLLTLRPRNPEQQEMVVGTFCDGIGEASTSGDHQGNNSDSEVLRVQEKERMMEDMMLEGMRVGLVEAQNVFPALDIDTIMAAACNKEMYYLPPIPAEFGVTPERKIYVEGIINALHEAKLSFPTLDIRAIMGDVLYKGVHEEMKRQWSSHESVVLSGKEMQRDKGEEGCKKHDKKVAAVLKRKIEELQGIYDAEIEGIQESQEFHDLTRVAYLSGQREGFLEAHVILLAAAAATDEASSDEHQAMVAALLKGRGEELERLYDAEIEGLQNSEDQSYDLMRATNLNGLRDGVLEAHDILLAQDKDTSD